MFHSFKSRFEHVIIIVIAKISITFNMIGMASILVVQSAHEGERINAL